MADHDVLKYLKVEINEDGTESESIEKVKEEKIGVDEEEETPLNDMTETLLYLKEDVVEQYEGDDVDNGNSDEKVNFDIGLSNEIEDTESDFLLKQYASLTQQLNKIQEGEKEKRGKSIFPDRRTKQLKSAIKQRMNLIATQWKVETRMKNAGDQNTSVQNFFPNSDSIQVKSPTEPQLFIIPKNETGSPGEHVEEVFVKLKVPPSVGISSVPDNDRDPEVTELYKNTLVHEDSVYEQKRKQKKVDSERQRRAGINKLVDILDYWVGECEGGQNPYLSSKISYCDKVNRATRCIKHQEQLLANQEAQLTMLHFENIKLKSRLTGDVDVPNVSRTLSGLQKSMWPGLYSCTKCGVAIHSLVDAFVHEQRVHPSGLAHEAEAGSVDEMFMCKDCSKVYQNKDLLDIHSLLHLDLTYFQCSDCPLLFGLPSKLKRHMFLDHGKLVGSEGDYVVDMANRVKISNTIQVYVARAEGRHYSDVENFIEASLDAKLILDEIKIEEEVDKISVIKDQIVSIPKPSKSMDVEDCFVEEGESMMMEEIERFTSEEIDEMESNICMS